MRIAGEPTHEPVGFSPEAFPGSRRLGVLALLVMLTIGAGVAAAVRLA